MTGAWAANLGVTSEECPCVPVSFRNDVTTLASFSAQ